MMVETELALQGHILQLEISNILRIIYTMVTFKHGRLSELKLAQASSVVPLRLQVKQPGRV